MRLVNRRRCFQEKTIDNKFGQRLPRLMKQLRKYHRADITRLESLPSKAYDIADELGHTTANLVFIARAAVHVARDGDSHSADLHGAA